MWLTDSLNTLNLCYLSVYLMLKLIIILFIAYQELKFLVKIKNYNTLKYNIFIIYKYTE